jgi:serine/threonine-protein kinase
VQNAPWTVRAGPKKGDLVARRFVIEERLGEGATGVVVAARDQTSGARVAIKIARTPDRESSSRFQRHARMMARLRGPHIVRVHDVGETSDGLPFMVMELLEGRSLGAMLASLGPLAPDDALRWMAEACDAIADAHDLGIIHRDIRPENLFLQRKPAGEEIIRVLDFGLAPPIPRIDEAEARLTKVGGIPGTSFYMAPEQVMGGRIDARTDVWGVGACLYRLLTGRFPFDGTTLAQVMKGIRESEPAGLRPGQAEPGITPATQDVLRRCLAKVPRDRFPNLREVASALRGAREELRKMPAVVPSRPPAAARFETDRISAVPTAPSPELVAPRVPRIGLPSERSRVADATDEEPLAVPTPLADFVPPGCAEASREPFDTDPDVPGSTIREPSPSAFARGPASSAVTREWADTTVDPTETGDRLTEVAPPTDRATIVEDVPAELVEATRRTVVDAAYELPVSSRGTEPIIHEPRIAPSAVASSAVLPPTPKVAPIVSPPTPSSFVASSDVIEAPASSVAAPSSFLASSDVIEAASSVSAATLEPPASAPAPVASEPVLAPEPEPTRKSAGAPDVAPPAPLDSSPDHDPWMGPPKRRGVLVVGAGGIVVAALALVVWLMQRNPEKRAIAAAAPSATVTITAPASAEPPASTVTTVAPFVPSEASATPEPSAEPQAPPRSIAMASAKPTRTATASPPPPATPSPSPTRTGASTTPPHPRPQPTSHGGGSILDKRK